ncbi:MAG: 4-hydroxythreonine-4-phosphate dehydrogenase PdxA [Azospirillaceae bacterium]|nr:4-hydroxythreonine-4-phosphate dehydrogenase PdxA [Azospirillaceae bacterium]
MNTHSLPVALTMGEPAGIGGELTLMVWRRRVDAGLPVFFVIDWPQRLAALARRLGWDLPIEAIADPEQAQGVFDHALPVLPTTDAVAGVAGKPDPGQGRAVLESIDRAVILTRQGRAAAIVTNPIQKSVLYDAGFGFPGHTEYLAHLAGIATEPVMMLEGGGVRVVPVTIHIALKDVAGALTQSAIIHCSRVAAAALRRDFGIARPRLTIAALNPHAGEQGAFGREEIDIIAPAVKALQDEGIDAVGPAPADTLFHQQARSGFDAAICMYHDQALIPLKTLDFDTGVNITLGLPFVRTSPDHGTALSLAGTGRANPASLIQALRSAAQLAARRRAAA